MQRVLTVSSNRTPLMPCHPARARWLLRDARASVLRRHSFTIVLHDREDGDVQPVNCRLDPGSRTTGMALVVQGQRCDRLVWAGELTHRSAAIKKSLDGRRAIRRARRACKTRYRQPRFDNRTRVANLVIACRTCNEAKANSHPDRWPEHLRTSRRAIDRTRARNMARIWSGWRPSLKDAAAVNATRYATDNAVKRIVPDTTFASGGRTSYNRKQQGHPKTHWVDAGCVGERGFLVRINASHQPLSIRATGWGSRQMQRVDRYGFPRTGAKGTRRVHGFQTGDQVEAIVPTGRKTGRYVGRVAVRRTGSFNIQTASGVTQGIHHRHCRILHRADGYLYT